MKVNYYRCNTCKKIVEEVIETPVKLFCCGKPMDLLTANTTDAATEKHVPVVTIEGNKVRVVVGDVAHPMTPEHSIEWISVVTENGVMRKNLTPDMAPEAEFLTDEKVVDVYAWCNLHGLWKATL